MRFKKLYIKKNLKIRLGLWLNFRKTFYNSFFLNYFLNYFLIFNFNSFNSFNKSVFTQFLNFMDLSVFRLNNLSKNFFSNYLIRTLASHFNKLGALFFVNFLSLFFMVDFFNSLKIFNDNENFMRRFNYIFFGLGFFNIVDSNFLLIGKLDLLKNKNYKILKTILSCFKVLIKRYLNYFFLLIYNYLGFFTNFFVLFLKKCLFFNMFLSINVNYSSVR